MPWEIRRNYGGCSGYAVVKLPDGSVSGCHSSRGEARAQLAALYASEPEAAEKEIITNRTTPNKYPDYIGPKKKKVKKMMEPGTFSEGDFAMGTVDDEVHVGQIVHIMTDGMLGVEGSKKTIMASPDNPAILIRIFEQHEDGYWKETDYFVGFDAMTGSLIDPLPMKAEYFAMGGTENNGSDTSRQTDREFVEYMMERIGKADSVRVGQMVSWNSSGGRATGKVTRVIRNGKYNVPNSEFTITGTPDDPAVAIRVYRNGEPTDTMVGHKMSTLRRVGKSMNPDIEEAMQILKSLEKGYKDKEKSMDNDEDDMEEEEMKQSGYKDKKNKSIDSDSANKPEVPSDLSNIFSNMPRHAKRVNTTGNSPVNFKLFRGEK